MNNNFEIDNIILNALKEDMPFGDLTTESIIHEDQVSEASIIAKEDGVIAGTRAFGRVFELFDAGIEITYYVNDGDRVKPKDVLIYLRGKTCVLLKGERTALNLLGILSGIATKTAKFVEEVKDLPVAITDTRKTTPGLRFLQKYAVRVGGGINHRFSLSDGVLIKDNHIKAAGGITNAVKMAHKRIPHTVKIEVETETLEQVAEAVECGADIIMLDNMDYEMMKKAVIYINKRALTEASGNVELLNGRKVRDVALTGVDIISVGDLTHTIDNLDISMRIVL
jgi:nicotinate-nucleotide pyrophosphorylase (carboxylating)